MPTSVLKISGTGPNGVWGRAAPNSLVQVRNLSAAPYGPGCEDNLETRVRADAKGRFSCVVPAAREGDVVRVSDGGPRSWLNVRMHGLNDRDQRRVELDLQGWRLLATDRGDLRLESVRHTEVVAEPGATLRFTNERTRDTTDVILDDEGHFPAGLRLSGEPGDTFGIATSDGTYDPSLKQRWGSLIATRPGVVIDDPPLDVDSSGAGVRLTDHAGDAVVDGIHHDDPLQGALGDCWLVATMSAIAEARPGAIHDMISKRRDGAYDVTFKRYDHAKKCYVDHVERVQPTFHRAYGAPLYGASRGRQSAGEMELWWPLVEKAYAQWKGGFDAVSCGYPTAAFEATLGAPGRHCDFEADDADTVLQQLADAAAAGAPVVLCTYPPAERRSADHHLVPDHAYTLLGVRWDDDTCYVKLRNPWGEEEPPGDGKNDGIFEMPADEFLHYFAWGSIGPTA